MSNFVQQERHARLQFPVHKIEAKTPAEFFEYMPGLRRFFEKLVVASIDVANDEIIDGEIKKVTRKERGYNAMPIDFVRTIKYIVLMYDPDSDLNQEYPDNYRLMKDAAAAEAGFKRLEDGNWPPYVTEMQDLRHRQFTLWILDYLKVKRNHVWQELRLIEEELDQLYRQRMEALIAGKINPDHEKMIQPRLEKRETLTKKFFAEHLELRKASKDEMFPITPENVFKEMKIPLEHQRVKQIKDVSEAERLHAQNYSEFIQGMAAPGSEA